MIQIMLNFVNWSNFRDGLNVYREKCVNLHLKRHVASCDATR